MKNRGRLCSKKTKTTMQINSPFKFLDAFTEADKDVFFGREKEVEQLYESVNKNRLVLVYGQSGTGKTSLVQCGLAAKFDVTDWYPIFVRRQGNINESLQNQLQKVAKKSYRPDTIATLERLNTKFLRPVYLIFDQFEELLILGDYETEQLPFAQTLKSLLQAPELACHIILIFREEYMASLYPFERTIPQLFDRRLRVERMSRKNVQKVILNSCEGFNIQLEKGKTAANLIIDNLSGERSGIPLPYLQVYMDLLYREDFERTYPNTTNRINSEGFKPLVIDAIGGFPPLTFTLQEITDFGKIENVLEKFLNEQNDSLQSLVKKQHPNASSNVVRQTLDAFVTDDGTKQPLLYRLENKQILLTSNAPEHLRQLPIELCTLLLQELENRRLLRRTETTFELAHDSLADLIDQQRTDEQRQLNDIKRRIRSSFAEYQQTHEFLSRKQLTAYEDFLPQLQLNPQLQSFIAESREDVEQREQAEKQRQERELQLAQAKLETEQRARQRQRVLSGILGVFLLLAIGASIFAFQQTQLANTQTQLANEKTAEAETEKENALNEKERADSSLVIAEQERQKAQNALDSLQQQKALTDAETQKFLREEEQRQKAEKARLKEEKERIAAEKARVAAEKAQQEEAKKNIANRISAIRTLLKIGDTETAKQRLTEALRIAPNHPELFELQKELQ